MMPNIAASIAPKIQYVIVHMMLKNDICAWIWMVFHLPDMGRSAAYTPIVLKMLHKIIIPRNAACTFDA